MRSILFGIGTTDFSMLAIAIALLAVISVFAILIPANRAADTDPMQVLRAE
jgi:ABC-type lipoprotein release transport system permease subunit